MNKKQFEEALAGLGLNHSAASRVLGIDRTTVIRYANGQYPVAPVVERLLELLAKRGIPREWMR